jgi:hypothetical protein
VRDLFAWLRHAAPSQAAIRAEIWSLGARHRGEPLEGALSELGAGGLPAGRTALLRACVGRLQGL